jgi:uncharacterized membrane protein YfcA
MSWPDVVNGIFEAAGGAFVALNVRRLLKDKTVAGVSLPTAGFFAAWGYWNIFYYPHLDQWWSFAGGLTVTIGNTVWIALAMWYRRKERRT